MTGPSIFQPLVVTPGPGTFPLQPVKFVQKNTTAQPYSVVVLNSEAYVPLSWDINNNAHGATGSATVTLSIGDNPDFSQELFRGDQAPTGQIVQVNAPIPGTPFTVADLNLTGSGNGLTITDNSPVYIQIYGGFPSSLSSPTDTTQLVLLWYGIVDQYSAAFTEDRVTFACRSFAAPLVDQRVVGTSMSQTSVAFLQAQAEAIGMTFVPILPPGYQPITIQQVLGQEFVGGANFASALYGKRIWDLGLQCALFDNADMWVDKSTLYYAVPSLVQRQTIDLQYGRDIEFEGGLLGTHSPQFSKNVQVDLHTYQPRTRMSYGMRVNSAADGGYGMTPSAALVSSQPIFGTPNTVTTYHSPDGTVTVTSSESSGGSFSSAPTAGSESGKERYIYFVRNQSPSALNNLAQSLWRQISQHEYSIQLSLAVTPALLQQMNITSKLKLTDVPYAAFNAVYFPRTMGISMSPEEGFRVKFQAVSHLLPQGAV
jgi:hypothetical protein